jgi:hypothetical protein
MFLLFALIGWISPGLSEFSYSDFLISVVFIASLVVVLGASRFEYSYIWRLRWDDRIP